MRRGSGLADWDVYTTALRAVIDPYLVQHHRIPGRRVMARLGHQRLVSAAYHHHGGWATVIKRLGYPVELSPSRTTHLEPGVGRGRAPGPLADWDTFIQALRQAVESYRKRYRRTPTQDELIRSGFRSVVQAAHRHHQGLRHAMRFLKYRRKRRQRRCPSGLNSWDTFAGRAHPIWTTFIAHHRRLPSKRELLNAGHGAIVYAAIKYHGGLAAVHLRLGFASIPTRRRPRRSSTDWSSPAIRTVWLERHFPDLIRWGIAPTRAMARRAGSGLVSYSTAFPGKWPALIASHGLLSHRDGSFQRRRAEVTCWALDQYEQHGQWPQRQRGPHVGIIEYPRSAEGWLERVSLVTYHRPVLQALVTRWKQHLTWIRQHQPELEGDRRRRLNQLIIASNVITPLHRLG